MLAVTAVAVSRGRSSSGERPATTVTAVTAVVGWLLALAARGGVDSMAEGRAPEGRDAVVRSRRVLWSGLLVNSAGSAAGLALGARDRTTSGRLLAALLLASGNLLSAAYLSVLRSSVGVVHSSDATGGGSVEERPTLRE